MRHLASSPAFLISSCSGASPHPPGHLAGLWSYGAAINDIPRPAESLRGQHVVWQCSGATQPPANLPCHEKRVYTSSVSSDRKNAGQVFCRKLTAKTTTAKFCRAAASTASNVASLSILLQLGRLLAQGVLPLPGKLSIVIRMIAGTKGKGATGQHSQGAQRAAPSRVLPDCCLSAVKSNLISRGGAEEQLFFQPNSGQLLPEFLKHTCVKFYDL